MGARGTGGPFCYGQPVPAWLASMDQVRSREALVLSQELGLNVEIKGKCKKRAKKSTLGWALPHGSYSPEGETPPLFPLGCLWATFLMILCLRRVPEPGR